MLQQVFTLMYQKKKKKNYLPPVRKVVALQNKTNRQTNTKPLHTIQTTSSPKLTVTAPFFNIIYIFIYKL